VIWDDVIGEAERLAYEKAGWGGTVGFGQRPALLVVDMYRAFVDPEYPFSAPAAVEVAERIGELLDAFRARSLPVVFSAGILGGTPAELGRWKVRAPTESALMQHPRAYEMWPRLAPRDDEPLIRKRYPSAFFGTTLTSVLTYHAVDTVVVTGTVTSGCVRATCLDAFQHNYRVIVPQDCVCDRGDVSHKVALFEIQMKYGDVLRLEEVLKAVE
jgi:nicotinamidase-related amidase